MLGLHFYKANRSYLTQTRRGYTIIRIILDFKSNFFVANYKKMSSGTVGMKSNVNLLLRFFNPQQTHKNNFNYERERVGSEYCQSST